MSTNRLEELAALDRAHLVHPVSPWRQQEARGPLLLQGGRGAWLTDGQGRELLDGFAGLWCVNVGYGQESVVEAAAAQMRQLPYATGYFGLASEPAIRLAAQAGADHAGVARRVLLHAGRLGCGGCRGAPDRAVLQRHRPAAEKHFISLERGYHGSSSTGRRADGAAGVPPRLRPAAAHAAPHRFAEPLPPPRREPTRRR